MNEFISRATLSSTLRAIALATLAVTAGACGDGNTTADASDARVDSGTDVVDVAMPDNGPDVVDVAMPDSGPDAAPDVLDVAMDTGVDVVDGAAPDAPEDAPLDVMTDVGCSGTMCGATCIDTTTDVHQCGACGNDCTTLPNVSASAVACVAGTCSLAGGACLPGFSDCDGSPPNGCETDVTNSTANCGACGTVCSSPANATSRCTSGVCAFDCNPGYMPLGTVLCVPASPPRLIAPLSTATVTRRRPTLRWRFAAGAMNATVQICADRACGTVITEFAATSSESAAPSIDLPVGTVFWRVRPEGAPTAWSPTWQFVVPARDTARDSSYGTDPDLDGDGLAEVIAGAPRLNTDTGRVYVYSGRSGGISTTPSTWVDGPSTNTWFGMSVASAGDVNGDGFADLVVGAGVTNSYRGAAYVYYGSPTGIHSAPDIALAGPDLDGYFGYTVAAVGDVNGDGYADLGIGAPQYASNSGRLYLYFGSASGLTAAPSMTINSVEGTFSYFARSFASGGDVNGDGYADLFVAAHGASVTRSGTSTPFSGRVHVYFGTATGLPSSPSVSLISPDGGAVTFGYALSGPGDLDGDGLCDLVVGAPSTSTNRGRVHVFAGHTAGLLGTPTLSIDGPDGATGHFGWSVAINGDVNGDGFSDLVASADYAGGHGHVYLGSGTGLATSAIASQSQPPGVTAAALGHTAAIGGDTDGDRIADFVITGVDGSASTGFVAVYAGNATTIPTTPARVLNAPDPMAQFGQSAW